MFVSELCEECMQKPSLNCLTGTRRCLGNQSLWKAKSSIQLHHNSSANQNKF